MKKFVSLLAAVAIVVLPQVPEDDPQKLNSYVWKADELVTVGVWVYVCGCGGFDGGRDGGYKACRAKPGDCGISGDAGAFPECEVNTQITPDHTTIQEHSSG